MIENDLTAKILNHAFIVHSALGPGLLESAYKECLFYELQNAGISVEKEHPMPIVYKSVKLNNAYRVDIWVERKIIIELKAVDALNDVHQAQLLTYLKLANNQIGLLINFNVKNLKEGIKRLYNKYYSFE